ncbi:uncharacterized protein LOC120360042 [Solenopsis invicta]|uniref:uncharacterized protein LOC120360042 n=1 Tax=Solenopsis invicta TaxID=13686 RepID=UPI00193E4FA2|nr:uncharacterized protein LOC120360042 [Solenopsis invicta]XP_039315530.1 uncharacterized protein LOC120360042 [Solenopsis invicta]
MANQFLHDSHAQLEKIRSTLSNSEGVLILFRTKTEQESHVVAFVQSQDKKYIYLKTWYAQKNDDNFTDIIHDAIDLSRTKFNITIYAAISDKNLGSIDLNGCRTPWSLQCHKSFAASVEVDLVDFELAENVRYLLDEFSSRELQENLIVHGGTDIKLRNCSHSHYWNLFSSCMKNYGAMRQLVGDRECRLKKNVVSILIEDSFEEKLKHALDLLEPIHSIAQNCEQQNTTIADIVEQWLMVVDNENYKSIQCRIEEVLTPIALTANLLHPIYRGKRFAEDVIRITKTTDFMLEELDPDQMNEFGNYRDSTKLFSSRRLKEYDALSFWRVVSSVHPKLSSFAMKILRLPVAVHKSISHPANVNDLTPK